MRVRQVPQPFQYQGSKRIIAEAVIRQLDLERYDTLVEPFAGSAAVTIRAALEGSCSAFWVNDANEPLVALLRAIVERPTWLADAYDALWQAQQADPRVFYTEVRARFNSEQQPEDLLYLLSRAVKGAVRYNSRGEFNQSPDNRRLGTKPATLAKRFRTISAALAGKTQFTSIDYRGLVAGYRPGQVWYMDPPYEGVSQQRDSRYVGPVRRDEFEGFLAELVEGGIPFVLSYDGATGDRRYGEPLPAHLQLERLEIDAGPSTSATLLGRSERTVEALYLSPAMTSGIVVDARKTSEQLVIDLTPDADAKVTSGAHSG